MYQPHGCSQWVADPYSVAFYKHSLQLLGIECMGIHYLLAITVRLTGYSAKWTDVAETQNISPQLYGVWWCAAF